MGKYFGTDGFRGKVNVDITPTHAYKIGKFIGWYLKNNKVDNRFKNAKVLVGKDTRNSGDIMAYSLICGLIKSGANVYYLGETSTPCVGYLVKNRKLDMAIMITASHNPYQDNGLKILNALGEKVDEDLTLRIESFLDGIDYQFIDDLSFGFGKVYDFSYAINYYVNHLKNLLLPLKDLTIVFDTANGGSYDIARRVFDGLNVKTIFVANKPNGVNINLKCGATYVSNLQKAVKNHNADIGFAFDGDADRCICVLSDGKILDGDAILYILSTYYKQKGLLKKSKIVSTIMSNVGLKKSLSWQGITVEETKVGDIYVYKKIKEQKLNLGGESAGHIIFPEISPSGDGLATAIKLLNVFLDDYGFVNALKNYVIYPQITINIPVVDKDKIMSSNELKSKISEVSSKLGNGRLLVRASGTEPVVRVTAESLFKPDCVWAVTEIEKVVLSINSTN